MKQYLLFSLLLWLGACATKAPRPVESKNIQGKAQASGASFSQKVYFFQHKLVSEWLFFSDGAFFFDMINGSIAQFMAAATDVVGADYADNISITLMTDYQVVVLGFPEPRHPPNCYFALIRKQGDQYAYYTYEKTPDLWERPYYGVVGAWNKEGNHENFGPRDYRTQEAFVDDILQQIAPSTSP